MTDAIGTVTMYPKLERREWIFGTAPDPRDARIAELEAALCEIRERIEKHIDRLSVQDVLIMRVVDAVLPRPPEGDMTMTVEDLTL